MKGKLSTRNGLLYCVLYYTDSDGAYQQKWISTGLKERGNRRTAEKILETKLIEFAYLETVKPLTKKEQKLNEKSNILFIDWLNSYIDSLKNVITPYSYHTISSSYRKNLELYWRDKNITLANVTSQDILDFYDDMKKTRNVKNITIKHYASIIRPALKKAFKERLIKENPYDYMPIIKKEKFQHSFYDQNDMELFFNAIKGNKLELEFKILAYYGLRRSELLGLQWNAIDFVNKTIAINHKVLVVERNIIVSDKMKTESSNRTLPLIPAIEKGLLKQKERIEKNRAYWGSAYKYKYQNFVFVNEIGELILPDHITHTFEKILKENNLKHIRLHDLRHSCASIMLANGVQMKQIQEWLGHSNFSTTADVYSHLDFSSKIKSAETIASALNINSKHSKDDANNINELNAKAKLLGFNSVEDLLSSLLSK